MLTHITTRVNPEDIMLSETSKSQKDKYHKTPLTRGTQSSQCRDGKQQGGSRAGERRERGVTVSQVQSFSSAR